MNGAAEAASQGGGLSGAMWAAVAIGLVGFFILIFPDIVIQGSWRWLFGLMGFFVRLFPEDWQRFVARLLGVLYIVIAVVFAFLLVVLGEVAVKEELIAGMTYELEEMDIPYKVRFIGGYEAEIYLPDNPDNKFTFQFEDQKFNPPEEVARRMIEDANRHFGIPSGSKGEMEKAAASTLSTPPPGMEAEDLPTANRLIEEAIVKWQAGDINGSVQLAERALQIKIRILGDEHLEVLQLKDQLQKARTAALQNQIKPQ
ncbi:tetratricopeptide repeat protein [Candidatus Sumerlaeota bacterium]|nr:tetratricopeptide repeat protein [Candidatus Sumerlaeota bacterium]